MTFCRRASPASSSCDCTTHDAEEARLTIKWGASLFVRLILKHELKQDGLNERDICIYHEEKRYDVLIKWWLEFLKDVNRLEMKEL